MDNFNFSNYLVSKKIFKLFGGAFNIYGPQGQLVFYSKMKAFKLKEDIRLYTSPEMTQEVLLIQARQILDFSAAYDVIDSTTGQKIGVLKRKGLKSMFRDEWIFMNANDQEIGVLKEDSLFMALLRRMINLIPQTFHAEMGGRHVCTYKQNFNPFTLKFKVDFTPDTGNMLDKRLGLAAVILLCAIEGRQQN